MGNLMVKKDVRKRTKKEKKTTSYRPIKDSDKDRYIRRQRLGEETFLIFG